MDILYLLIPLSALLVLAILGVFAWAVQGGQFDDLDGEGRRILDAAPLDIHQGASDRRLDAHQTSGEAAPEQSSAEPQRP
ncbi:MAG: cbb3-type cytochrome oxidase assembly protein CcoS [Proteobacteria bacterium]|nr:cbb3-type cytochrome oxidase assembly protein CcoS [Pseudomonadota bacterium]